MRWDPAGGLKSSLAKAIYPGLSWVIEIGMTQNARSWKRAESAKTMKTIRRSGDEAAALSLRRLVPFITSLQFQLHSSSFRSRGRFKRASFAWLWKSRCLSKDYVGRLETKAAPMTIATSRLLHSSVRSMARNIRLICLKQGQERSLGCMLAPLIRNQTCGGKLTLDVFCGSPRMRQLRPGEGFRDMRSSHLE